MDEDPTETAVGDYVRLCPNAPSDTIEGAQHLAGSPAVAFEEESYFVGLHRRALLVTVSTEP